MTCRQGATFCAFVLQAVSLLGVLYWRSTPRTGLELRSLEPKERLLAACPASAAAAADGLAVGGNGSAVGGNGSVPDIIMNGEPVTSLAQLPKVIDLDITVQDVNYGLLVSQSNLALESKVHRVLTQFFAGLSGETTISIALTMDEGDTCEQCAPGSAHNVSLLNTRAMDSCSLRILAAVFTHEADRCTAYYRLLHDSSKLETESKLPALLMGIPGINLVTSGCITVEVDRWVKDDLDTIDEETAFDKLRHVVKACKESMYAAALWIWDKALDIKNAFGSGRRLILLFVTLVVLAVLYATSEFWWFFVYDNTFGKCHCCNILNVPGVGWAAGTLCWCCCYPYHPNFRLRVLIHEAWDLPRTGGHCHIVARCGINPIKTTSSQHVPKNNMPAGGSPVVWNEPLDFEIRVSDEFIHLQLVSEAHGDIGKLTLEVSEFLHEMNGSWENVKYSTKIKKCNMMRFGRQAGELHVSLYATRPGVALPSASLSGYPEGEPLLP
eukprot:TRINITY_DN32806_c0_g1_i1.p1 TRINITY_DN32806_c0_g1~~TRINITY_DN32806_c0_g1_i1.p1  ORF type:complete len:496 (-),score=58.08 TRINITY_DN32806_c0_g1_i1:309-1796(-)